MNTGTVRLASRDWAIIALTCATALIHASRALADPEIAVLFALNSLGYGALLAGLYLPLPALAAWRPALRRVLIGYAALTIVLWGVWVAMSGEWSMLGVLDKLIEIALIVLLLRKE